MPFNYNTWGTSWGTSWGNSWGVSVTPVVVTVPQGGGTSKPYRRLPQYYSRRSVEGFEKVELPQDSEANPIAIDLVRRLADLNQQMDRRFFQFQKMLAEVKQLAELAAAWIESQQIMQLLAQTEQRIYALHDAKAIEMAEESELGELLEMSDEHDELMELLDAS